MNTCQHNALPAAKCNSFMRLWFAGTEVSLAIVLFLTSEPFPFALCSVHGSTITLCSAEEK